MAKKSKDKAVFSFETAMARLEEIVAGLESGELTLEDSLKRFEEGVGLVKECRTFLESSRQRVELLISDERGRPKLTMFEEDVEECEGSEGCEGCEGEEECEGEDGEGE